MQSHQEPTYNANSANMIGSQSPPKRNLRNSSKNSISCHYDYHNQSNRSPSSVFKLKYFSTPSQLSSFSQGLRMEFLLVLSVMIIITTPIDKSQVASQHVNSIDGNNNVPLKSSKVLEMIRDWTLELGLDISSGTEETTCMRSLRNQYDPNDSEGQRLHRYKPSIESIDWTSQHKDIVKTVSKTMQWHQNAVEAIVKAAEDFASKNSFNKNATIDYYDVHKIEEASDDSIDELQSLNPVATNDLASDPNQDLTSVAQENRDELPENLPKPLEMQGLTMSSSDNVIFVDQPTRGLTSPAPSKEFSITNKRLKLNKHANFGPVAINTEFSAVHTPVHIYPGDPQIMNDIIWSEKLTTTFKENFIKNPKLTNQFFASQAGFLRLFPAQKWQVKHDDPDLYDARMRPWYSAGASSRKDVVILVDSSGSMTGSRRDIARGVALEILDTLTDNDRFVVLKFSDSIQQVGVPPCPAMSPKNNLNTNNPHHSRPTQRSIHDLPPQNKINLNINNNNNPNNNLLSSSENQGKVFKLSDNETIDIDSFYLLPANKRNVRHIRANFNIPTVGIANFSRALITAFEVLRNYANDNGNGDDADDSQGLCNQAIMLVTDGSPSDFIDIFQQYNYPNIPVRVFTYLIGREAGDITHTRMMACRNKGYYTHVINLAEVREAVQQYIPVMARPLVLNKTHPITWTPAYGELTYQILTDWIWESKRRDKVRMQQQQALAATSISTDNTESVASTAHPNAINDVNAPNSDSMDYDAPISDEELEAIDLFGYQKDRNCFWQTHRNDLLTTVVQPVYDTKNQSLIIEKFLLKNTWQTKESIMRTAKLLGVAAADMKINDIIALAPSHKLGPNAYTIMLTNNGFAMHHPDLRSILEPYDMTDPIERAMQVLKPFFSTIDFTQVEHISMKNDDELLIKLRKEAVSGLTGFRQLQTKRAIDCQRRPQLRNQSFYYEPLKIFPFSFITAVPQPYGSHHIRAQVELKSLNLPEKVSNYLIDSSPYELWTLHPDYQYCDGPSNNSVTNILDLLHKIETNRLDDIQWKASESLNPPITLQHKLVCDKDLVQSLIYDAIATYSFSDKCSLPNLNVK